MVIALYGKVINKQLDFKGEKYIVILFVTQWIQHSQIVWLGRSREQDMLIINSNLSAVKYMIW